MKPCARAVQRLASAATIFLTTLVALQTAIRAQESIFPQLVGVWNHLKTAHSIDVRNNGDVWSTGRSLARASSTIAAGGNFAFEGEKPNGGPWRCVYYITFLADKVSANWRFVSGDARYCPDGLYAKIGAKEGPPINDCDRLAAAPSDATRPVGVAGVAFDQIDAAKAIRACQVALESNRNDPRTLFQLGRAYLRKGDTASLAEAARLFRLAAGSGHAPAMHNLGVMYRDGRGVTRDDTGAVRWFRQAADAGYPPAMGKLGLMYRDGRGVDRDDREAVRWFRQAAEAGDPPAMGYLGYMYQAGQGVTKDAAQAVDWYRRGAASGDAFSKDVLSKMGR